MPTPIVATAMTAAKSGPDGRNSPTPTNPAAMIAGPMAQAYRLPRRASPENTIAAMVQHIDWAVTT